MARASSTGTVPVPFRRRTRTGDTASRAGKLTGGFCTRRGCDPSRRASWRPSVPPTKTAAIAVGGEGAGRRSSGSLLTITRCPPERRLPERGHHRFRVAFRDLDEGEAVGDLDGADGAGRKPRLVRDGADEVRGADARAAPRPDVEGRDPLRRPAAPSGPGERRGRAARRRMWARSGTSGTAGISSSSPGAPDASWRSFTPAAAMSRRSNSSGSDSTATRKLSRSPPTIASRSCARVSSSRFGPAGRPPSGPG